jgi:phosphoribosyl-AMP cyclohydrolase
MNNNYTFGDRADKKSIETGSDFAPKFGTDGLIPVVTQDAASGAVLMVAYMNQEALRQTLAKKEAVYYSRSRSTLWHKGATSGHVQKVIEARTDCDQDVILLKVEQIGPGCCHAGYAACFYRKIPLGEAVATTAVENIPQLNTCEPQTYNPSEVYKS